MRAQDVVSVDQLSNELITPVERIEFHLADDVMVKQLHLEKEGYVINQHAHTYDHTSMLATGKVRVFCDGKMVGDFTAPTGVFIKANAFHAILALEDNSILYCVHNTHGFPPERLEQELVSARNPNGEPK